MKAEYLYDSWVSDEPNALLDSLIEEAKTIYEKAELVPNYNGKIKTVTVWVKKEEI